MTLNEAIERYSTQAPALRKHLGACGLTCWNELTTAALTDFVAHLKSDLAPGTARNIASQLSKLIRLNGSPVCEQYREILRLRGEGATATYLNLKELKRLKAVPVRNESERFVLTEFIVATKIGCRHSDLMNLTPENVSEGLLTYTSIKTGVTVQIPCSNETVEQITWLRTQKELSLHHYNTIIRRLCQRAGINENIKLHKAGKDVSGPKWKFITSHSARRSVATNLSRAGMSTHNIMCVMGHTNENMTNNYIVRQMPEFNLEQLKILE